MNYHIVPDLKLIYAWSPKCACTTVKSAVLMALGHEITGNVHNDMLTQVNLKSGKYGIHHLWSYRQSAGFKLKDYRKICMIRNPYSRYVSAIRQRSRFLCENERFRGLTAAGYLEYMESNEYGEDHHFHPQTRSLKSFAFDRVLDISEMGEFFGMLNLAYDGQRFGNHRTTYGSEDQLLHSVSLQELSQQSDFPESVHGWLDEAGKAKLRVLYSADFDFASSHGYNYELSDRLSTDG